MQNVCIDQLWRTDPCHSNNTLQKTAHSFVNIPILDPKNDEYYLSPKETVALVINKKLTHDKQQTYIPPLKNASGEAKKLIHDKKEDLKYRMIKHAKARGIIGCVNCEADCVVYSMYEL